MDKFEPDDGFARLRGEMRGLTAEEFNEIEPAQIREAIEAARRRHLMALKLATPPVDDLMREVAFWRALSPLQSRLLELATKKAAGADRQSDVLLEVLQMLGPDVSRGKAIGRAAAKGHEMLYGNAQDKADDRAKYIKVCREVIAEHPNWGICAVREEAGSRCGVSARTILRQVPELPSLMVRTA